MICIHFLKCELILLFRGNLFQQNKTNPRHHQFHHIMVLQYHSQEKMVRQLP